MVNSPNFWFLEKHEPLLLRYAAQAERYVFDDPNTALIKLRQFVELLAEQAAACAGISVLCGDELSFTINELKVQGIITAEIADLFHGIRKAGNAAAHEHKEFSQGEALYQLRMARSLAVWFHKAFGKDPGFKPGAFIPPPQPEAAEESLKAELTRLNEILRVQEEELSRTKQSAAELAAKANKAYQDLDAALELAQESEERLKQERSAYEERLSALHAFTVAEPAAVYQSVIKQANVAAQEFELDEWDTRKIIDKQLKAAGWEVDTAELRYEKGVRPQKGRNLAIAEWPTVNGPADYVLFVGLMPVGVVEAKRKNKNVSSFIRQAKRYSKGFRVEETMVFPGGPWESYSVPFLFSANGRPYLKQIVQESGIWFLDARLNTNHPRALSSWYTPDGLLGLLGQDLTLSEERLRTEPKDYLPLREYQLRAISRVEEELENSRREMLVAMATGTGKTRLCVCLLYRLLKAKRFRRALFLVDRNTLGTQALDTLKDVKLENYKTFTEIYDVKELGDLRPEKDTRLQVATVQSIMKRVLFPSDDEEPLPVDAYDLIVIDECHRGYTLDRDMSESELCFRSEEEYVSKYRRVLDYFDAVKIGLTATPALHTVEIFGAPVFTYSYPEAVVDGWLRDYEPPIKITTKLGRDGITWEAGSEITVYRPKTQQLELINTADEVHVEIEEFNKRVLTDGFNLAVCRELARHIDPNLPGKTLVFCVNDKHADVVVEKLKQAFLERYGEVEDDAIEKITGAIDKPLQAFKRYKNERLPSIAVTVDYLTTGIDVEEIVNLVFIRRVRSRILFEQMLGRATRNREDLYAPGEHKESFRIFDAVDVYAALEDYNSMKPVVVSPNITFERLIQELSEEQTKECKDEVLDQLIGKLRRKLARLSPDKQAALEEIAGFDRNSLPDHLMSIGPEGVAVFFFERAKLVEILDERLSRETAVLVSSHADEVVSVEQDWEGFKRPEDYLEGFTKFIEDNLNRIPALVVVKTKPSSLTRKQLKEISLLLAQAGYSEVHLKIAYQKATNEEIAASIIGYIRRASLGAPLMPYAARVSKAMQKIYGVQAWTQPQRQWLQRIEKQLLAEIVVDRESLDSGQFQTSGGFNRLNKIFDGKLENLLTQINDEVWKDAA